MTFRGRVFREGDHYCLDGRTDGGRQTGGQRLDWFMESALHEAMMKGQEVMISVVVNPEGIRAYPRDNPPDRPVVEGGDPIASAF